MDHPYTLLSTDKHDNEVNPGSVEHQIELSVSPTQVSMAERENRAVPGSNPDHTSIEQTSNEPASSTPLGVTNIQYFLPYQEEVARIYPSACLPSDEYVLPQYEKGLFPPMDSALSRVAPKSTTARIKATFGVVVLFLPFLFVLYFLNNFGADTSIGQPEYLSCDDSAWFGGTACRMNAGRCSPFRSDFHPFRCSARCMWGDKHGVVGTNSGGYRADSSLCEAAIHSGAIDSGSGGCFQLQFIGGKTSFSNSSANGISSYASEFWFPKAFTISSVSNSLCVDFSFAILVWNILFVATLSCLAIPRPLFYIALCSLGYWYVVLVGAPRYSSENFIARALGDFLPFLAVVWLLYSWIGRVVIPPSTFVSSLLLLFVAPFIVTLHLNMFSYFLPNISLSSDGFDSSGGGIAFLFFIVLCVLLVGVIQSRTAFKAGMLPWGITFYAAISFILLFGALLAMNSYDFHLHHYLFALLLLPGTRFKTKLSLVCHGLLMGAFVNGVSEWSYGSILEPKPDFVSLNSPTDFKMVLINGTFSLRWQNEILPNTERAFYGILMNDVLIHQSQDTFFNLYDGLMPLHSTYSFCVFTTRYGTFSPCSLPVEFEGGPGALSIRDGTNRLRKYEYDSKRRKFVEATPRLNTQEHDHEPKSNNPLSPIVIYPSSQSKRVVPRAPSSLFALPNGNGLEL